MNKKVIRLDGSNEEALKRLDEKIEKMNVTEEEWKKLTKNYSEKKMRTKNFRL